MLKNIKNSQNGVYYDQVITESKKRFEERDKEFTYNVPQARSKFKRCVSICRKAALTINTARKSLDLGFKNFTKLFVPRATANPSNRWNLMLAKKV